MKIKRINEKSKNEYVDSQDGYQVIKMSPRDYHNLGGMGNVSTGDEIVCELKYGKMRPKIFYNLQDAINTCKEIGGYSVMENGNDLDDVFINPNYESKSAKKMGAFLGKKLGIKHEQYVKESYPNSVTSVEPKMNLKGRTSYVLTSDRKWEVDFDSQGNFYATRRHGKPYYFVGNINDMPTKSFPNSEEDMIVLAAREGYKNKFEKQEESINEQIGQKHPDQEKITKSLLSVPNTSKVEFDWEDQSDVYKDPENHLIILVHNDDNFGDREYFVNRRKWKQGVLGKLRSMGWTQEDPVEDNGSYLYLVMQKRGNGMRKGPDSDELLDREEIESAKYDKSDMDWEHIPESLKENSTVQIYDKLFNEMKQFLRDYSKLSNEEIDNLKDVKDAYEQLNKLDLFDHYFYMSKFDDPDLLDKALNRVGKSMSTLHKNESLFKKNSSKVARPGDTVVVKKSRDKNDIGRKGWVKDWDGDDESTLQVILDGERDYVCYSVKQLEVVEEALTEDVPMISPDFSYIHPDERKKPDRSKSLRNLKIYHDLFDKYQDKKYKDYYGDDYDRIESEVDIVYPMFAQAEDIVVVEDFDEIPRKREGQPIRYKFSAADVDIYCDPYKDFIYVVDKSNRTYSESLHEDSNNNEEKKYRVWYVNQDDKAENTEIKAMSKEDAKKKVKKKYGKEVYRIYQVDEIKESLSQETSKYYDELNKLNGFNVGKLVNEFIDSNDIDFNGDILYSQKYWNQFINWAKKAKGLEIKELISNSAFDESLNEASYGGAYDIRDDQYFTREDLVEVADEIMEQLSDKFGEIFVLNGAWFENRHFIVNAAIEDGMEEYEAQVYVDMRKIRKPSDLKKYIPVIVNNLANDIEEFHTVDESLNEEDEDFLDDPYSPEEVEKELKSITRNFTIPRYDAKCGFKEEADAALDILKQHYKKVNMEKRGSWYFFDFEEPIEE